jgi:hypothetical protein
MDMRSKKSGGFQPMDTDVPSYGCCACIGSAGTALMGLSSVMQGNDGLYMNLYIPGVISAKTPEGTDINLKVDTLYPVDEKITNHDSEQGSHPYILQMMKQRYDAMYLLIEQYRALVDGTATDDDIKRLIAEHNRSQYAHQDLFNEVQTTIDEHTSATNNPHEVTKAQVGLDKVDNTPDNEKYVAYASNAGYALNAEFDMLGNSIPEHYATKDEVGKVDLSNYYTKDEIDTFRMQDEMNMERHVGVRLDESLGSIDAALDSILAIQNELIGG